MCLKVKDLFLTANDFNESKENCTKNFNTTDVVVTIEEDDGYYLSTIEKYIATFFSYDDILELKSKNFKSGEYLNGKYFFFKNMVIIDNCCRENIKEVVNHLVEEGDFKEVFKKL